MNAVEIEEAVSELAAAPFDAAEFPFAFLTAFGNKATTVNRLRTPSLNKSDVAGGVLQARNIHLAVCAEGQVRETMASLRASPKTGANKAKFILATDGLTLEAEDLVSDEPPIVCNLPDLGDHFGFFLPLAGISTVRAIKNNPIDIKATGRLNKLYVELLKDNPGWATEARRQEMNQFMARLIFCFFAEDTGIFLNHLFTKTIEQMSDSQSGNTHEVLQELFRAMDTKIEDREAGSFRPWADAFPYVNGGLFTGSADCPRFSRIARSYLLRAAELNWQEINPDIFGSMIQAVADEEERGELGMHYTSVPNILKVLNPLFLDELREQLDVADDNLRKLRNLRKRLSTIRVFDPACGSGNFLVIAYIRMREIEHEIVKRTGDDPKSWIPLSNFYGIEIKGFAAEIARLSLLIAEFQCDVRLINQQEAQLNVLPLHRTGQIHTGNALRLNWLEICPPATRMEQRVVDLFGSEPDQSEIDFEAKEIETYICGNPPFKGARKQTLEQKEDLSNLFNADNAYKDCDYVSGWYIKASSFIKSEIVKSAFVSTSSICEGEQVAHIWSRIFAKNIHIFFGHRPFSWSNNAQNNAGVHCVIVGLRLGQAKVCAIFDEDAVQKVQSISPYLVPGSEQFIASRALPLSSGLKKMVAGSMPRDGGFLILSDAERSQLLSKHSDASSLVRRLSGTNELINGEIRWCLWIEDDQLEIARSIESIERRIEGVLDFRMNSKAKTTNGYANIPHKFAQRSHEDVKAVVVSATSSEKREYLPASLSSSDTIITNAAFAIYDGGLLELSIIFSRLHLAWIAAVCGKLETRYRYSSTLGWNTFPAPPLTEKNKADLKRCAEEILLARESHFPATIADLYDPENMPSDLRSAHERNDETLERIYIGRRFRNDTERLEKLFDLYTKMAAASVESKATRKSPKGRSYS